MRSQRCWAWRGARGRQSLQGQVAEGPGGVWTGLGPLHRVHLDPSSAASVPQAAPAHAPHLQAGVDQSLFSRCPQLRQPTEGPSAPGPHLAAVCLGPLPSPGLLPHPALHTASPPPSLRISAAESSLFLGAGPPCGVPGWSLQPQCQGACGVWQVLRRCSLGGRGHPTQRDVYTAGTQEPHSAD